MENILQGIPQVTVYLDDILIAGRTEAEHLTHLEMVLTRLRQAGLRNKCSFTVKAVEYLGHAIAAHVRCIGTLWPQVGTCPVMWFILLWCQHSTLSLHARWHQKTGWVCLTDINASWKEVFTDRERAFGLCFWSQTFPQLLVWSPLHPLYWPQTTYQLVQLTKGNISPGIWVYPAVEFDSGCISV